jgi:hypothetical protein
LLGKLVEDVGGGAGLQFESVGFNHRFSVHCYDAKFEYALIDARMMETLVQCEAPSHVTFGPSRAMVWCSRLTPDAQHAEAPPPQRVCR